MDHHHAGLGDVRLHYATAGSGFPVVLLHGWPQRWYEWRLIMPGLAERFRVIAPDLRGLGDSSRPEGGYDKKTVGGDIWRLTHEVLGISEFHLVGHDWGAAQCQRAGRSMPSSTTTPRRAFHFTPTSASWLNAVEGFFAKLAKRVGSNEACFIVVELQAAINRFLAEANRQASKLPTFSFPPEPKSSAQLPPPSFPYSRHHCAPHHGSGVIRKPSTPIKPARWRETDRTPAV